MPAGLPFGMPGIADEMDGAMQHAREADCFAGQFMRSVSVSLGLQQADVERIQRDFFNSGDDVLSGDPNYVGDHGHGRSRRYWGSTGLGTDQVGRCNSFTAPSGQVR